MRKALEIIVPSRRRPGNMAKLFSLLPAARVLVDKIEEAEYAAVCPPGRLILHPSLDRISKIRNFALDSSDAECVVMADDDLTCVRGLMGSRQRKIVEPEAIARILWNAYQTTSDLNLSLFGFARDVRWAIMAALPHNPYSFVAPAAGCFGIVGKELRFDDMLVTREDVDVTLQALLKQRILLHDRRFYFDFGRTWKGAGGNQGRRTAEVERIDNERIASKWGSYISFSTKDSKGAAMSIRVKRKSELGTGGESKKL